MVCPPTFAIQKICTYLIPRPLLLARRRGSLFFFYFRPLLSIPMERRTGGEGFLEGKVTLLTTEDRSSFRYFITSYRIALAIRPNTPSRSFKISSFLKRRTR